MDHSQKLLIIDHTPAIETLIRRHLEGEAVSLHAAATAEAGLELARQLDPDLILLELDLPDADAFEVLKRLKSEPATMRAAVVLLASASAQALKLRGLDLGAFDYVHKPFDPAELRARVRAGLRMQFLARLLATRSMIDGVTGLRSRDYFHDRLKQEMALAIRTGHPCSCVLLDIDGFRKVNDTYGHRVGDEVLKQVAKILTTTCRAEDLLCRHGGGQFVALAPNTPAEKIVHLAERMRAKLESTEVAVRGGAIRVTASFGIADVSREGAEQTLRDAQDALDCAKSNGGNAVMVAGNPRRVQTCAA
jgi:diguanylate cyclase (GGDEF)-like protein